MRRVTLSISITASCRLWWGGHYRFPLRCEITHEPLGPRVLECGNASNSCCRQDGTDQKTKTLSGLETVEIKTLDTRARLDQDFRRIPIPPLTLNINPQSQKMRACATAVLTRQV